jgi:hypothetical protein
MTAKPSDYTSPNINHKQQHTMKTNIPQQIIVPVYYHVENGEVQFDFEQMTEFFENELSNIKY